MAADKYPPYSREELDVLAADKWCPAGYEVEWARLIATARASSGRPTEPTPEDYDVPEAKDLLALFRLAAMDGYNKKPVATVDEWVEECKKRMLLLYFAAHRGVEANEDAERLRAALERIIDVADGSYGTGHARVFDVIREERDAMRARVPETQEGK